MNEEQVSGITNSIVNGWDKARSFHREAHAGLRNMEHPRPHLARHNEGFSDAKGVDASTARHRKAARSA
jgi:hypothetical protein